MDITAFIWQHHLFSDSLWFFSISASGERDDVTYVFSPWSRLPRNIFLALCVTLAEEEEEEIRYCSSSNVIFATRT